MSGSNAPNVLSTPQSLNNQNTQNQAYNDQNVQSLLNQVASGKTSLADAINQSGSLTQNQGQLQQEKQNLWNEDVGAKGGAGIDQFNQTAGQLLPQLSSPQLQSAFMNELATGPTTGGMLASYDVANNPLLQGALDQEKGQLNTGQSLFNDQSGLLSKLQNQGFQLTPEDQTLYGQASGNIARQFGQSGNDLANSLAQRGLSSSGAAGAQFSGLMGSQNEMLAQAQQQIMQQRYQNTLQQIGQQQQFMNQLNAQNNQMAGQYANSAQGMQNQAYQQNLEGLGAQNQFQNQNIQNNQNQQAQNQNEQNEQFAQQQSTNFGSQFGKIAGGIGSLASGAGSLFGGGDGGGGTGAGGGSSGSMGAGNGQTYSAGSGQPLWRQ